MDLKRVSAPEAKTLVDDGYVVLDVRSIPEYTDEHIPGAYNVPYLHKTPHGMIPNQDFVRTVQALFPEPGSKIVAHCQMGGRGIRAAQELLRLGYTQVVEMRGGFGSERDETGRVIHPGWKDSGLPTAKGDDEARGFRALSEQVAASASSCATSPEGPRAAAPDEGMNRFASATRRVVCAKLGRELPGLKRRPYPGALGERLFNEVSAEGWNMWVEHSKMIINEYRINSADQQAMNILLDQCEQFFFGEGAALPEGYVPQAAAK